MRTSFFYDYMNGGWLYCLLIEPVFVQLLFEYDPAVDLFCIFFFIIFIFYFLFFCTSLPNYEACFFSFREKHLF